MIPVLQVLSYVLRFTISAGLVCLHGRGAVSIKRGALMTRKLTVLTLTLVLAVSVTGLMGQEQGTADGEWPTYGGNLSNDRYSPLDQVTAENFSDMEVAWQFSTDSFGPTVVD